MRRNSGFSLVELLIVLAILALLLSIGLISFNAVTKKGRDAARLADLSNLYQAINAATHQTQAGVYPLCINITPPCEGDSKTGTRYTDGTGYIKVNFDDSSEVNLPTLPVDPLNNSQYFYRYYSDGINWKLEAKLESDAYKGKMQQDGGSDDNKYEIGSRIKQLN